MRGVVDQISTFQPGTMFTRRAKARNLFDPFKVAIHLVNLSLQI